MLFVVVVEFFICWTPLYVINTITLFDQRIVYQGLGYTAVSFFQLLAYSSSCCNPITYCFMNIGFRKAFVNLFRCFRHEPGRRISVSGYCMTSAGSAEAQILAATVNSLMQNESSSNNITPNEEEPRDSFLFQEQPMAFHPSENPEAKISTNFLN
jgi:7 transmembrane receptor (rhodopsin family)